jgi:hypothetical protein
VIWSTSTTGDDTPSQHRFRQNGPLYIHHLSGQKFRLVLVEDFRLTLAFDQGDLLRIYSNNGLYECDEIYDETGSLIVF